MVGGRVLGRVDFGELAGRETSEMEGGGGRYASFLHWSYMRSCALGVDRSM
jgi:hypothetical protein